jgi:hypothetical protein
VIPKSEGNTLRPVQASTEYITIISSNGERVKIKNTGMKESDERESLIRPTKTRNEMYLVHIRVDKANTKF